MNFVSSIIALCSLFAGSCGVLQTLADISNPKALWWVVSSCVQNEKAGHTAAPCEQVNLEQGYVLLKDRRGNTQFLLVPIARLEGIESPELQKQDVPNYWQIAWDARKYVSQRAGKRLSDRDIGLEVNSSYARTQNQLHIHIDCLKPQVIETLATIRRPRDGNWFNVRFPRPLHTYRALYVDSLEPDPFKVLAKEARDMARETLAVARVEKGFILLADTAAPAEGNFASGEELLDHDCKAGPGR